MPPPPKRRKINSQPQVEEINFDLSARQEYLTGFHKRKVQRTKQAQEAAERRAREERIADRKRLREERKADLERHLREVNALLRPTEDEGSKNLESDEDFVGDWEGIEDIELPPIDHEAEYIDEDKYTTVTVETMDASREGLAKLGQNSDEEEEGQEHRDIKMNPKRANETVRKVRSAADEKKRLQSKLNKRKKRSFKYEGRTERKVTRSKEKLKNSKQAKARKAG